MNDGGNARKISDWMRIFQELYSDPDLKRTPEQIWLAIMAHCSLIGESIRKVNFLDLLKNAAHMFCWLCSYVNKCNQTKNSVFSFTEDLSELVSLKYPLVCGHCKEARCHCDPTIMDEKKDKAADYKELLRRRKGIFAAVQMYPIDEWQDAFQRIYSEQIHILTLESIGFHFLEEVGEGAMAVRMLSQLRKIVDARIGGIDIAFLNELITVEGIVENYRKYYKSEICYIKKEPDILKWRIVDAKMHMVIEIGDTFSWLCSILNKLRLISKDNEFDLPSLEKKLNEEYFDEAGNSKCPTCEKKPCLCIFFS